MEGTLLFGDIVKGLVLAHANCAEQTHSFNKMLIVFSISQEENVLNYAVFYPKLEQLTKCVCVPGEKMMNVFVLLRDRRYSMFISDFSTNILFYVLEDSR